jgi:hypothetical protein
MEGSMAGRAIPTMTRSEQRAAAVKRALKAAALRIPGLKAPHAETRRRISGRRTVPKKFIRSMMAAVDRHTALGDIVRFDSAEAEAALQFEAAFRSVRDQIANLLASLTYTIELRMAPVAEKAMDSYAIAKGLARDDLTMARLVARLKRDLGRKGPRKKKHKK